MVDDVDIANDRAEAERQAILDGLGRYEIPAGEAGNCSKCGKEFPRLVNNACPPCRDKYNLG